MLRNVPIQRKMMTVIMFICGIVLFITSISFFAYEHYVFRQTTIKQLSTLGEILADNSTAALTANDSSAASDVLAVLKAENNIVAACIYDQSGNVFSVYPPGISSNTFASIGKNDFPENDDFLESFQVIRKGEKVIGTLYLRSDRNILKERLILYGGVIFLIMVLSFLFAYLLSLSLQKHVSKPLLALAETAKAIYSRNDFSVRAVKHGKDEIGLLAEGFNMMLDKIQSMQQTMSDANKNLELRVKERTKELELVNHELESFSYMVSHDLKAPLRSIQGFSSILKEDYSASLDEGGRRLTGKIIKNAEKMRVLIEDIMTLAQIRSASIESERVNMMELAKQVIAEVKIQEKEGSKWRVEIQNLPDANGDEKLLRQVWVNLISNAAKYSRKKEHPEVTIGSYIKDKEIVFFVKDNGAGFNMKYIDKLFEVFQRLHHEREFEGTGIGLAIVKKIITRHKGTVWAEGKEEEGATFYFSLPYSSE